MLAEKRRQEIVRLNYDKKGVSINELANFFQVSKMTIVRDIKILSKLHLVIPVRGGIIPVENIPDQEEALSSIYNLKKNKSLSEKQQIAKYCANYFIKEDHIITLESGSTATFIVKMINPDTKITLITNGLLVLKDAINYLGNKVKIMSSGGILEKPYSTFVGPEVERFYKNKDIDIAFISCVGFNLTKGPMDSYPLDVQAKQAMIKSSKRVVLLIDKHKFHIHSIMQTCPISSITDIVTNQTISKDILEALYKFEHIKIHLA